MSNINISGMTAGHFSRVLATPFARALLRGLMRNRASIFMLHRVTSPATGIKGHTADFVREAITALRKSGAKFVSLSTIVERWSSGQKVDPDWIAFTLDDGFADQAELVQNVFIPMGCPATIFLITDFLDGKTWPWDDQLSHALTESKIVSAEIAVGNARIMVDLSSSQARRRSAHLLFDRCKQIPNESIYDVVRCIAEQLSVSVPVQPPVRYSPMSWAHARELERAGVEFGPHSMSHRILSQLTEDEARREMSGSWLRLKEELRNPLPIFAWPTGRSQDFTPGNMALARELGFRACVATDSNYAYVKPGYEASALFRLCRFPLPQDLATVIRYGSGFERGRQLLPI